MLFGDGEMTPLGQVDDRRGEGGGADGPEGEVRHHHGRWVGERLAPVVADRVRGRRLLAPLPPHEEEPARAEQGHDRGGDVAGHGPGVLGITVVDEALLVGQDRRQARLARWRDRERAGGHHDAGFDELLGWHTGDRQLDVRAVVLHHAVARPVRPGPHHAGVGGRRRRRGRGIVARQVDVHRHGPDAGVVAAEELPEQLPDVRPYRGRTNHAVGDGERPRAVAGGRELPLPLPADRGGGRRGGERVAGLVGHREVGDLGDRPGLEGPDADREGPAVEAVGDVLGHLHGRVRLQPGRRRHGGDVERLGCCGGRGPGRPGRARRRRPGRRRPATTAALLGLLMRR